MLTVSQLRGRDIATVQGDVEDAASVVRSRIAQGFGWGAYEVLDADGNRLALVVGDELRDIVAEVQS